MGTLKHRSGRSAVFWGGAIAFVVVIVSLMADLLWAQGADPDVPRHFTLQDVNVAQGQLVTVPLWLEMYEQKNIIHLRFELDPKVAEFVGALPGKDLKILGQGGCWELTSQAYVRTANERPFNPGWQLNYLRLSCFGCGQDGITGSIGAWRDLGIQSRFHVADIIIRGNAVGVTPIWLDRRCSCEPTGGCLGPGPRDSFVSWYVNACPGEPNFGGASFCMRDPDTFAVQYVSFSNDFLPPPELAHLLDEARDPVVRVGTTATTRSTWGTVKRLYR